MTLQCMVAGLPGPVEPQRWENPAWPPKILPDPTKVPEREQPASPPQPQEKPAKVPA
jgi:hypothetical protein